ncbi:MAG: hypothetical protein RLZZ627_981 [Pseudomonadota bacterium]|jgi:hypothetical protein
MRRRGPDPFLVLNRSVVVAVFFCWVIPSLPSFAGSSGSAHYRLRVTPDYDSPGVSLISEFNVYGGALYTNAMMDYLTEDGWDVGINSFNIPVAGTASANGKQYDTFLNITKFFFPTEDLIIGLGTQNGTHFSGGGRQLNNFDFAQMTYEWDDWLKLTAGGYYVNSALSDTRQNGGALVGIDIMFIPQVFWTEMDWLSGNNNLSGAVVNNFWRVTNQVTVYAGLQIPAENAVNDYAGILGFAFNPNPMEGSH